MRGQQQSSYGCEAASEVCWAPAPQEGQLRDVYTGGRQETVVAANIERALTQRDEFGRIMTPKERFRVLNYGCAGGLPSDLLGACQRECWLVHRGMAARLMAVPPTRRFHGIDPSRNKKDRKFRKVAEEQERKRRAMSDAGAESNFDRIQAVQRATAAPYLVRLALRCGVC